MLPCQSTMAGTDWAVALPVPLILGLSKPLILI
jgi:hypothetical protein